MDGADHVRAAPAAPRNAAVAVLSKRGRRLVGGAGRAEPGARARAALQPEHVLEVF